MVPILRVTGRTWARLGPSLGVLRVAAFASRAYGALAAALLAIIGLSVVEKRGSFSL